MSLILSGTDGVSDIDGTAATPAIRGTDANTGIFFPAADTIGFAEGGVEAMRIDSSGNIGIGTSSPGSILNVYNASSTSVLIQGDSATNTILNRASTDTGGPVYLLRKSRGTIASPTAVSSGDTIGSVSFQGYGGTNNRSLGSIQCFVDTYTSDTNISSYLTFATSPSGSASPTERMRIDSSGNVGIGTSSPAIASLASLNVKGNGSNSSIITAQSSDAASSVAIYGGNNSADNPAVLFQNNLRFGTTTGLGTAGYTERARITNAGDFLVGGTSSTPAASNVVGFSARSIGLTEISVANNPVLYVNRKADDGTLVSFRQDGTEEGTISVSGNTVSYNGFSGGHWTQLPEGRGYNPEILRGTVMSTIGEMCEWKSVVWDEVIEHPAVPAVEAKEAVVDEEGNVVEPAVEAVEGKDAWTETITHREHYLGQLPVGATFEEDGVTKTVVDDGNERLPKVKISDVVGDKAVYGVFQTWDEVQDMLVTSLGAFVVRIAAGVTVQIGDLLESNGDGCAKVQDDDVIRSKTIGKVTSTTPSATYADGSYTVPCVIYCG